MLDVAQEYFYAVQMLSAEKFVVVIPCLNEAAEIFSLVTEIRKLSLHVIVVDDGSTDATGQLATSAGAEVIRHEKTQGKGAALNHGLRFAREKGFQRALTMDGDGQHAASDIGNFLSACESAALVVGNRMANPESMPGLRRFVNRWMSRRLSKIAGKNLPDTQCGFRSIDLEAWSRCDLQTAHFEVESELLLAFIAAGHAIKFVPIQVIYKNEQSKISPVRDTLRWWRWLRKAERQFKSAPVKLEVAVPGSFVPPTSPALHSASKLSRPQARLFSPTPANHPNETRV